MGDDELRLTAKESRLKRARRRQTPEEKLSSGSATVRVEAAFQIAYQREWGFPVIVNYGRDRKLLTEMIDQVGEELVLSLIPEFMAALRPVHKGGDPVVSKSRYGNVPDFKYHAQYLLLRRRRGEQLAGRTAENVHEIAKAVGRTKD